MGTVTRKVYLAAVLCLAVVAAGAPASADSTTAGRATTGAAQAPAAAPQQAAAPNAAAPQAGAAAAPYCGITWGSARKQGGVLRTPQLVKVVTSRNTCWDRTVFEFDGAVNGYDVLYSTTVATDGEGLDLAPYVAGAATKLSVSLRAPAYDYPRATGEHAANVVRYRTLRDVLYGGSFEGYSTFAVGVRAKLPFRVFVAAGPGTHSRIIIDVAHLW
jgi:hypothetical protein